MRVVARRFPAAQAGWCHNNNTLEEEKRRDGVSIVGGNLEAIAHLLSQ